MQTRTALKRLSKGGVDYADRVTPNGPLAQNASWLLEKHANQEQRLQTERERHELAQSMPILEAARRKLAEATSNKVLPDDTPIAMRFDVFNVIKQATKQYPKDTGLRMFATHLQRLWHKEPTGTITAGALTHLRDHYQTQNPRSVVGEITDTAVPKVAFNNLPVAQLTRIASEISSQDDYNTTIIRHGLHRDDVRSIRARAFIRELVNRKAELETELKDDGAATGIAKRSRAGDISERVVKRIIREGQSDNTADSDTESADTESSDTESQTAEAAGMGQAGSGMLFSAKSAKLEWAEMMNHFASTGEGLPPAASDAVAVAPPGWEETVKQMKDEPGIDNAYALAWWMEGKGYQPDGEDDKKSDSDMECQAAPPPSMPMPVAAGKSAADSAACFEVKVNPQQPDQVSVPDDGGAALKGKSKPKKAIALGSFVVKADHPLVDDGQDHFPAFNEKQAELVLKTASELEKAPTWWLGSTKELSSLIEIAFSTKAAELKKKAGDLPPEFKENIEKKKKETEKKAKFNPEEIEARLLDGKAYEVGGLSLKVATNNNLETIELRTKRGSRKYPLSEIDGAIADFMFLAKDEKVLTPPTPSFVMREGFRMTCPACYEISSYPMPKKASDINCSSCHTLFPEKVIKAAFNVGVAGEEATLIAFAPVSLQEEFGEKFANAAEMMGADSIGANGARAEAYAKHPGVEKMAEIWDFLTEAGFKPLAQFYGQEMPMMTGADEDMPPMDMDMGAPPPMPGAEEEMSGPPSMDVPDLGDPNGGTDWADHQMVQAAMMHYRAQGNTVTEAITQFTKDYGDGYDPETVMQVASQVFSIGLDQVKIGMNKDADIPATKVNQQQPDYVNVGTQPLGPGDESDTKGEIPTEKPNAQVPAQSQPGTSAGDTSMSHGSDTKESIPTPGKPKSQHPATDQKGVKLPPVGGPGAGLGSGDLSDTAEGKTTRKWDSESAGAYNNQRSK